MIENDVRSTFKNLSKAIYVLGNGPSLRNVNLHLLFNYDSIGMNLAYRHWHRINWYPTYYTCLDTVMIEEHKEEIRDLVFNYSERMKLFFLRKKILNYFPEMNNYSQVLFLDDYLNSPYFSGITNLLTTGSFAALFAAMLGYKRIHLLGVDFHKTEPIAQKKHIDGHVYEVTETPEYNPNYFIDDYQRKGDLFNIPNSKPGLHDKSWVAVKERLECYGVDIINCNPKRIDHLFDNYKAAPDVFKNTDSSSTLNNKSCITKNINGNLEKTILVSGFFPQEKISYFEKLDYELKKYGYKLLLHEQTSNNPKTKCSVITTPISWYNEEQTYFNEANELSEISYKPGSDTLPNKDYSLDYIYAALLHAGAKKDISPFASLSKMMMFEDFVNDVFAKYNISLCMLWHQFTGRNHLYSYLCRKNDIPYLFLEFGSIPGTIVFEAEGGMAEGRVFRFSEDFKSLKVDYNDLLNARRIIDFCRNTKLNRPLRKEEAGLDIGPLVDSAREKNRKIIFYAGQNDWGSGILPELSSKQRLHSPIYRDTFDALNHLVDLAEKNNWQVLFKPHPYMSNIESYRVQLKELRFRSDHLSIIEGADIFACIDKADVCTTILSQSAYQFLIHKKPTVLLGKMQLSQKECLWEPNSLLDVESALKDALEKGFKAEHYEKFVKHVAQLSRYHLYSMDNSLNKFMDKDVDIAAESLVSYIETQDRSKGFPFYNDESFDHNNSNKAKEYYNNSISNKMGTQSRKLILLGFFLSGSSKRQILNKFNFWLDRIDKIKKLFKRTIVIEYGMNKTLKNDSNIWETYRMPKYFHLYNNDAFKYVNNSKDSCIKGVGCKSEVQFIRDWEYLIDSANRKPTKCSSKKAKYLINHGYNALRQIANEIEFQPNDLLVTHGFTPVSYILRKTAEAANAKTVFTEHGELPNTIMVSEKGMFYNSWPYLERTKFLRLCVNSLEVEMARQIVKEIATTRASHRASSQKIDGQIKNLNKGKPVIYLNGIFPVESGLIPRNQKESIRLSPHFSSNFDLLKHLALLAKKNGWHIIYKDHPLTKNPCSALSVESTSIENVTIANDIDIHDILDFTDVMVSLASKSIILALSRGVPVCMPGPFTIPAEAINPGLVETDDIESGIKELLLHNPDHRVNMNNFYSVIAKLRKYYLYPVPGFEDEGTKGVNEIWHDLNEYLEGNRKYISISDELLYAT